MLDACKLVRLALPAYLSFVSNIERDVRLQGRLLAAGHEVAKPRFGEQAGSLESVPRGARPITFLKEDRPIPRFCCQNIVHGVYCFRSVHDVQEPHERLLYATSLAHQRERT